MNKIECPGCGELIPDDSLYCDMCGVQLLQCIKCGALGTEQFCAECGKPMVSRNISKSLKENFDKDEETVGDKTVGGRNKNLVLKARKGGFILRPENEAVIGREKSPYVEYLRDLNLISRRHGKFVKRGCEWYIVDFGSTNGTLVNDVELESNTPMKFVKGDVIDIGTYIFDVIEQ